MSRGINGAMAAELRHQRRHQEFVMMTALMLSIIIGLLLHVIDLLDGISQPQPPTKISQEQAAAMKTLPYLLLGDIGNANAKVPFPTGTSEDQAWLTGLILEQDRVAMDGGGYKPPYNDNLAVLQRLNEISAKYGRPPIE